MPISMECPSCMNSFSLPDELGGRKTKCPECQFVLYVPHGETSVDTAASPPSTSSAPATVVPINSPHVEAVGRTPPSKKVRPIPKKSTATTAAVPPASDNPFEFNGKEPSSSRRRKRGGMGGVILLGVLAVFLLGGLLVVAGGGVAVWYLWFSAKSAASPDAPIKEEVRVTEATRKIEDKEPPKKNEPKEEAPKQDPPKKPGGKPVRDPILDTPAPMEKPKLNPNPDPVQPPGGKKAQFNLSVISSLTVRAGDKVMLNVSVLRLDCKGTVSIAMFPSNAGISADLPPNLPEDIDQVKVAVSVADSVKPGTYRLMVTAILLGTNRLSDTKVCELTVEKAGKPVAENPPPADQGNGALKIANARVHLEGLIYTAHAASVESVALSADGKWGLSGSSDGTVVLWELTKGQNATIFTGPGGTNITAVALSPDGKFAAYGDAKGSIRLQNLEKKETKVIRNPANTPMRGPGVPNKASRINSLVFSPKGDLLAIADQLGLSSYDLATGKETSCGNLADSPCLHFAADGDHVFAVSGKKIANLDIRRPAPPVFVGNSAELSPCCFDTYPAKQELIAIVPQGQQAEMQRISLTNGQVQKLVTFTTMNEVPLRVAVADKAGYAITSDRDGVIRGFDLDTGKELFKMTGHKGEVHGLAVSADGRRVLSGGADNTFRVVDLTNPK
jgi:hypothetical protein